MQDHSHFSLIRTHMQECVRACALDSFVHPPRTVSDSTQLLTTSFNRNTQKLTILVLMQNFYIFKNQPVCSSENLFLIWFTEFFDILRTGGKNWSYRDLVAWSRCDFFGYSSPGPNPHKVGLYSIIRRLRTL